MDKKYKEISFSGYTSIEEAVAILQEYDERGEAVCGAFNGHMLFSDRITVDGAYLELFGMDKADFEKAKQGYLEGKTCEQSEYQKKLPDLNKEWITRGHNILPRGKWDAWEQYVAGQSSQLYESIPEQCLDIVDALNRDCTLEEAKAKLEQQGHSGGSLGIVLEMIKQFSHRGAELADLF